MSDAEPVLLYLLPYAVSRIGWSVQKIHEKIKEWTAKTEGLTSQKSLRKVRKDTLIIKTYNYYANEHERGKQGRKFAQGDSKCPAIGLALNFC